MALSSAQISQAMAAQNSMFSGQMALSHQLAYQGQAARHPGMAPPSPAGQVNFGAMAGNATLGAANFMGGTAMPMLGAGVAGFGALHSLTGMGGMMGAAASMFDPFGHMIRGAQAGFGAMGGGAMGLAGGALGAAAGFLPLYAGSQLASAYGGAAYQGMQSQGMINNMLGANFNFAGGGGMGGRGFGMGAMGAIGGVINQAARQDPFSSVGDLTGLVGMGAQSGMFTAVRDVQQFTQQFRQMLSTLKAVQDQLGGSLQEAMIFVNQSKQSGIFKAADRAQFSGLVRQTADITGLSRNSVMQMTSYGSQLTRSLGGTGAQGAVGATLALQQLGAAIQTGAIDEELLSEATGGLTGDDAMMAFGQRMMQRTARLTRRGFGRYSIFGLSNEDGTGIDSGKMARFLAGDMSMGEIGQSAYATVNRIGRPRAMRNKGLLRASAIQQGGLAFEAGKMRAILGDRIMSQDDDVVQAVLQRRFRMNRAEATAMTSMIRNLPEIATTMAIENEQSGIDQRRTDFMAENQSLESVKRRIGSAINEGLGIADAREWGRRLYARVGTQFEKFTDELFGIARQEFSQTGRERMRRGMMGRGTADDFAALSGSGGGGFNAAAQLTTGLLQSGSSDGQMLQAAGFDVRGMSHADFIRASTAFDMANSSGVVSGSSAAALDAMTGNRSATVNMLAQAVQQGNPRKTLEFLRRNGFDPMAAMAFAKKNGMDLGLGKMSGVIQANPRSAMDRWLSNPILEWGQSALGLGYLNSDGDGAAGAAQRIEDMLDADFLRRPMSETHGKFFTDIQNQDLENAFANNEQLREATKQFALGLGDPSQKLSDMRAAVLSGTPPGKARKSALAMIDQLAAKASRGEDLTELAGELVKISTSPQDQANILAQAKARGKLMGDYANMSDAFGATPGGAGWATAGAAMQRVAQGDFTGIRDAQMALAGMGSVERSAAMSSLGDSPAAVGLRQGAMALGRQRRELRGGGRRGQWGARNAMFSMMGGVADSLDVEVNGRLVRGNTQHMLTAGLRGRGGARGEAAVNALRAQYATWGLDEDEIESALAIQSDTLRDGKIDDKEAIRLQNFKATSAGRKIDEAQKQRARSQDPLDADRNDHLAKIAKLNEKSELYLREMALHQLKDSQALQGIYNKIGEANQSMPEGE